MRTIHKLLIPILTISSSRYGFQQVGGDTYYIYRYTITLSTPESKSSTRKSSTMCVDLLSGVPKIIVDVNLQNAPRIISFFGHCLLHLDFANKFLEPLLEVSFFAFIRYSWTVKELLFRDSFGGLEFLCLRLIARPCMHGNINWVFLLFNLH